jgi:hypothetical protein
MISLFVFLIANSWSFGIRGAVLNDGLTTEKYDDNGFTNDLELRLFIFQKYKQEINIFLRHRMITERGDNKTRWDEGTASIQYLNYIYNSNGTKLSFGPHFELALGGNLGGLKFQNGIHHIINARTIEKGTLQDTYSKSNTYGVVSGLSLYLNQYIKSRLLS